MRTLTANQQIRLHWNCLKRELYTNSDLHLIYHLKGIIRAMWGN